MVERRWKATPSKIDPRWIVVIGPYDEYLIADIQNRIDARWRQWLTGLMTWKVHESQRELLAGIIAKHSPVPDEDEPTVDGVLADARSLGEHVEASSDLHEALPFVAEAVGADGDVRVVVRKLEDGRTLVLAVWGGDDGD